MPIYEFYCPDCHMMFNFLSKAVNTARKPACPRCKKPELERQVSLFATSRKGRVSGGGEGEDAGGDDFPIDEAKMERAMESLAGEAENLNEDDPRQAAQLMRKFSSMTGLELNENMKSALERMESGEDPEKIEQEMGDLMGDEDPFIMPDKKRKGGASSTPRRVLRRDPKLYDL
jgi:putative FmdB family regulatory protein